MALNPPAAQQCADGGGNPSTGTHVPAVSDRPAFDILPQDALVHIFSFIRLRPRICVLSFVCKRWRSAALRVPASLCYKPSRQLGLTHSSIATAALRLPVVEEMLAVPLPRGKLPPPLRRLRINSTGFVRCDCADYTTVSTLTELYIEYTRSCGCALEIAKANPGITKLTIVATELGTGLMAMRFPNLTHLHFDSAVATTPPLLSLVNGFLRRHSSSLQCFSLSEDFPVETAFPKLTSFRLTRGLKEANPIKVLEAISAAAPKLARFSVVTARSVAGTELRELAAAARSVLYRLKVMAVDKQESSPAIPSALHTLHACQILAHLDLNIDFCTAAPSRLLTQLRSLRTTGTLVLADLPHYTALKRLTLSSCHSDVIIPRGLSSLTELTVNVSDTRSSEVTKMLCKFLAACPCLRVLKCSTSCSERVAFPYFIAEMEKTGLEYLFVIQTGRNPVKWMSLIAGNSACATSF